MFPPLHKSLVLEDVYLRGIFPNRARHAPLCGISPLHGAVQLSRGNVFLYSARPMRRFTAYFHCMGLCIKKQVRKKPHLFPVPKFPPFYAIHVIPQGNEENSHVYMDIRQMPRGSHTPLLAAGLLTLCFKD